MTSEERELARETVRGLVWSLTTTAAGRLISLATLAVLARLLAPQDFGLLAFALVFIGYLETVGDLGTGMALIFWPERWRDVAQLTFMISLVTGFFWLGVAVLAAPAVADFFGSPDDAAVLRALAWTFPIRALGNTHDALLQRKLRFRTRLVPELALILGKAAVSVTMALAGFGVWSLVWGQVVGQGLWTVSLWTMVRWRPTLSFPRELVGPVFGYGRGIIAVNVLAAVVHHADIVVVGRMLGTVVLGFYQMAYRLPDIAVTLLVRVTSKVLFPAISRLHAGGSHLAGLYLSALRHLSLLTLPAAVALVLLARPAVMTVFGEQWLPSVPILRVLGVYTGLRALGSCTGDFLKGTGRPGVLAALGALRAVVLVPALIMAGLRDAVTVALALAAVTALTTLLNFYVASVLAAFPPRALVAALRPSLAVTAVLAATLALWVRLAGGLPAALQLAGGSLAGLAAYLAAVRVAAPDVFRRVRSLLGHARGRAARVEQPLAGSTGP